MEFLGIEVIVRAEFCCPECECRYWGTQNALDPFEDWVRYCKGCDFTWSAVKDWEMMVVILVPAKHEDREAFIKKAELA